VIFQKLSKSFLKVFLRSPEEAIMTKRFMNPNGKIIVPVNLDETCAATLKSAAQISKRTGLKLEVLHVSEYWVGRTWPTEMMLGGPMAGIITSVEDDSIEVATTTLKELVKKNLPGQDVPCTVLLGYPAESIRAHAVTVGADLIVLGGTADDYRFVPKGLSTLLSLMADAPCPVLVIPKGKVVNWETKDLNAIFADDLQPQTESAAEIAYEWATAFGKTKLTHAHSNQMSKEDLKAALTSAAAAAHTPPGAMDVDVVWNSAMKSMDEALKDRAPGRRKWLESRGGSVQYKVVQGAPVESILKLADETKADLMIFGRHRTWRRKPFAIGQLPFHSMLRSQRPVLIAEH
jgi:nucleotide-binding universal stress UspA family protein